MKIILKLITAITLALSMVGAAQAQDLFKDVASDKFLSPFVTKPSSEFRTRNVVMKPSSVDSVFNKRHPAETVTLDLFPGRQVVLKRTLFDRYMGEGAISWSGNVEGFEDGFATLVYTGSGVVGQVQFGGEVYKISPTRFGYHQISELDLSLLPEEHDELYAPSNISLPTLPSGLPEQESVFEKPTMALDFATPRVRVLIMFTQAAWQEADAAGRMIADDAKLAIAMANTAAVNTKLSPYRYLVAGIKNLHCFYDENAAGYTTLLSDVTDTSTCVGARTLMFRDARTADLVGILRASAGSTSCGVGWLNETTTAGSAPYGISLTSLSCVSGHTFTHEMGHNIGLHHDRYVVSGDDPAKYNFGFTRPDLATPIRTIMAYNTSCSDIGKVCTRVPLYSNTHPMGTWGGEVLGRYTHLPDPAVNRKKILENWAGVAAWR